MLIFPEGRRSADGALQPFKNWAFELAVRHGVPVIPIAVHGTGAALPKHGRVVLSVGRATPEKNPDLLLQAFARLRTARPAARLVMLGVHQGRRPLSGRDGE